MPRKREAEKISPHFRSRFSRSIIPPISFLPTTGTSQMPTMMPIVITAETVTYCVAERLVTSAHSSPMALRAFVAAGVS